ncbi:MAG: hypothetical protein JNM22_20765 [Saprospiraceae bacterium]|nr:hypothetical protein [Saprospiraceae bacterium]
MKHIWWYVLLLAVVVAGDRLAGCALKSQVSASVFRYSRLYGGEAEADILLLGNSRGLTFYQPYIEEKTGLKTFNLSYNGLPMDVAKALTLDYMDHYPAPKRLVIDITTCDRTNDELLTGFLTYSDQSYRLDTLIRGRSPKVWRGGQVSALFRFNNEIFQRALSHRRRSDTDWLLDRTIPPQLAAAVAQHTYPLEVHPYLVAQLRDLCAAAGAKGVDVRLVISPYFPGFAERVSHLADLKKAVEAATGLPVRDYSRALSDPAGFGDFMHPNKKGSQAYIDLMRKDGVLP